MSNDSNYRFEKFNMSIMMGDIRFSKKALKPGKNMPNIYVYTDQRQRVHLHDLISKKALVLVTGSLTCPMTISSLPDLNALEEEFKNDISFAFLYVREAHPGERYPQPQTVEEKITNAKKFRQLHNVFMPVIIDDLEGSLHRLLDTKPNSVHLINKEGVILFQSLWAGDNKTIKTVIAGIANNSFISASISQKMMGPFMRSAGYMDEALKIGGQRAYRELALGAPPIALLSKVSNLFQFLPKPIRGYAATFILFTTIAAAVSILH